MKKPLSELDLAEGEVLLFDKPKTWSSFDVVRKVRSLLRPKKVGHAGTLDPLATGLLILCTGKKTKTIESIQAEAKEYVVDIRFGAVTDSYDLEHPPRDFKDCAGLSEAVIETALEAFRGEIQQYPPIFSAVKIKGKRAYKSAREGEKVEVRPRIVQVYAFTLDEFVYPDFARATIRCGKGTYVRSLVHDLGQALGTGAYMEELRRTAIGPHRVEDAWEMQELEDAVDAWKAERRAREGQE